MQKIQNQKAYVTIKLENVCMNNSKSNTKSICNYKIRKYTNKLGRKSKIKTMLCMTSIQTILYLRAQKIKVYECLRKLLKSVL